MYVCKGEIIGFNHYVKDGKDNFYAQVVYESRIASFQGKRACSCRVTSTPAIGSKVDVLDDLLRPQIIEK